MAARGRAVKELYAFIDNGNGQARPQLLAGDFNGESSEEPMQSLSGNHCHCDDRFYHSSHSDTDTSSNILTQTDAADDDVDVIRSTKECPNPLLLGNRFQDAWCLYRQQQQQQQDRSNHNHTASATATASDVTSVGVDLIGGSIPTSVTAADDAAVAAAEALQQGFTFPACSPKKRIDFVFVRNGSSITAAVDDVRVVGQEISPESR